MRLKGKVQVRRLKEVALAHSSDLIRHALLVSEVAHMFDHGVGENEVELPVVERLHVPGVPGDSGDVRERRFRSGEIEESQLDLPPTVEIVHRGPEIKRAAHVQDSERLLVEADNEFVETPKPPPPQPRGEAVAACVVSQSPKKMDHRDLLPPFLGHAMEFGILASINAGGRRGVRFSGAQSRGACPRTARKP